MSHLHQGRLVASPSSSVPNSPQASPRVSASDFNSAPVVPVHVRNPSLLTRASHQISASPAYLLEWSAQGCQQTHIFTTEGLREEIEAGRDGGGDVGASASAGAATERLIVVHGLPADFVKTLRAVLDIDPAFLEAHGSRRLYKPRRWRRDARWLSVEFPELLRGWEGETSVEASLRGRRHSRTGDRIDLMGEAPVYPLDEEGDAVAFCRASLWMTDKADVLFLDRPIWRDPDSPLRKKRHAFSVTKPFSQHYSPGAIEVQLDRGDEVPSLEDELLQTLKDARELGDALRDVVHRLAHDQWLEYFVALGPHPRQGERHETALLWHAAQCLEKNLDGVDALRRAAAAKDASVPMRDVPDWRLLIQRNSLRVDLSRLVAPKINIAGASPRPGGGGGGGGITISTGQPGRNGARPTTGGAGQPRSGKQQIASAPTNNSDEINIFNSTPVDEAQAANQRSLDRISYLGGILLPLTVVSGVLSIEDRYGPLGQDFWVFWVASAICSTICILVIYIDQLRFIDVWTEVQDTFEGILKPAKVRPTPPLTRISTLAPAAKAAQTPSADHQDNPLGIVPEAEEPPSQGLPRTYTDGTDRIVVDLPINAPPGDSSNGSGSGSGSSGGEIFCDSVEHPQYLEQRRSDGSKERAWRRKKLGWVGAMRKVLGMSDKSVLFQPPEKAAIPPRQITV